MTEALKELDEAREDAARALRETLGLAFRLNSGFSTIEQVELAAKWYVTSQAAYTLLCADRRVTK